MGLWGEGRGQGSAGGRREERADTGRKLLEEKREINGRGGEERIGGIKKKKRSQMKCFGGEAERWREGGREEGRRRNK